MGATYQSPHLMAFATLAALGLLTNGYSVYHIQSAFDLGKSSFLLIFLDAGMSLVCCALTCAVSLGLYFQINQVTCSLLFLGIYVPSVVGPLLTAEVAILRYVSLCLVQRNMVLDENRIGWMAIGCLGLLLVYILGFILVHLWLTVPFSMVTDVCLVGNASTSLHPATVLASLAPTLVFPLVSLIIDALIVKEISQKVSPRPAWGSSLQVVTIPIRATVLSAVSIVPYMMIGGLLSQSPRSKVEAASLLVLIALTMNALRCPLTTLVTFAAKKKTDAAQRSNIRTKMINREVKYAQQARASRHLERMRQERAVHPLPTVLPPSAETLDCAAN